MRERKTAAEFSLPGKCAAKKNRTQKFSPGSLIEMDENFLTEKLELGSNFWVVLGQVLLGTK